jgi:hypothetical protein
MTGLIISLALGGLLGVLLILVLLRPRAAASDITSPQADFPSVSSITWKEREVQIMERIFATEDWGFLNGRCPAEAQRVFRKERRQIALYWLSLVQNQAKAAMRHHVSRARRLEGLQPAMEGKIAFSYLFFRMNCWILRIMVLVRGPVGLQRTVLRTRGISGSLLGMAAAAEANAWSERI